MSSGICKVWGAQGNLQVAEKAELSKDLEASQAQLKAAHNEAREVAQKLTFATASLSQSQAECSSRDLATKAMTYASKPLQNPKESLPLLV